MKNQSLNNEELVVKQILQNCGFNVVKIPETTSKTCDFRFSKNDEKYLLEVKARAVDQTLDSEINNEEFVQRSRSHGRTNRTSRIIQNAVKQLDSLSQKDDEFKLIWITISDPWDQELVFEQIRATLYGIQNIVCDYKGEECGNIECYYYDHSEFHKFQQLDAVILFKKDGFILLMNDWAERYHKFKQSTIYKVFGDYNAIIEPRDREIKGDCLLADCDIDRHNKPAMWHYIKNKYELSNMQPITYTQHSVFFKADHPDN